MGVSSWMRGHLGGFGVIRALSLIASGSITAGSGSIVGQLDLAGAQIRSSLSPASVGTTQTDWVPSTGVGAPVLRVATSAAVVFRSFGTGAALQEFTWININTNTAHTQTLNHLDGAGGANLKFICPNGDNYVVRAGAAVRIWYDAASLAFRVLGA